MSKGIVVASEAATGIKTAAAAVLLMISVANIVIATIITIINT
jgi:hypothetical protein